MGKYFVIFLFIFLLLPEASGARTYKVKIFAYNGHRKQTDRNHKETAFQSKPKVGITLAVSRDLKHLKNKQVRLVNKKTNKLIGIYTVQDLMAKRHRKSVDIYLGRGRKALKNAKEFGVQEAKLEVLRGHKG